MQADVPLLIPEVNADHLALLDRQEWAAAGGGIVTNPNCVVVGLAMALAPLHRAFGLEAVCVTTLQALSGAGYPGVPSLDALGNVIPFIDGEEEKIETEPGKILGTLAGGRVVPAAFPISVSVNRVAVRDGHTESVFVKLSRKASLAEIRAALEEFTGEPQRLGLAVGPAAADRRPRRAGPAAADPRRGGGARNGGDGRAAPHRPGLRRPVHPPRPQHRPRRGGRGAPERRAPRGDGPALRIAPCS